MIVSTVAQDHALEPVVVLVKPTVTFLVRRTAQGLVEKTAEELAYYIVMIRAKAYVQVVVMVDAKTKQDNKN